MNKNLIPTYIFNKIEEIPFELLERENIKGIFLDVDNTILDRTRIIASDVDNWIKEAQKKGITICILSNAISIEKVRKIMKTYNIFGLANAGKPRLKGFNMALKLIDIPKEQILMIGDQIFTDVLGANRFGIKSIYLYPRNKNEWIGSRIKRPVERIILKKLQKGEKNKWYII